MGLVVWCMRLMQGVDGGVEGGWSEIVVEIKEEKMKTSVQLIIPMLP